MVWAPQAAREELQLQPCVPEDQMPQFRFDRDTTCETSAAEDSAAQPADAQGPNEEAHSGDEEQTAGSEACS